MDSTSSCLCDTSDHTDPTEYLEKLKKKYINRTAKLQAQQQDLEKKIIKMEMFISKTDQSPKSDQCACDTSNVPRIFPETPVRDVGAIPKTITEVIQQPQPPLAQPCSFFQKMMDNARSILSITCQCPSVGNKTTGTSTATPMTTETTETTFRTTETTLRTTATPISTEGETEKTLSEAATKEEDFSLQQNVVEYDNTLTEKTSGSSCSCDFTDPGSHQEADCSCHITEAESGQQASLGHTTSSQKDTENDPLSSSLSKSDKCPWQEETPPSVLKSGKCSCEDCTCDSAILLEDKNLVGQGILVKDKPSIGQQQTGPLPQVSLFVEQGVKSVAEVQVAAENKEVYIQLAKGQANKCVTCCQLPSCPAYKHNLSAGIQATDQMKSKGKGSQIQKETVNVGSTYSCKAICNQYSATKESGPTDLREAQVQARETVGSQKKRQDGGNQCAFIGSPLLDHNEIFGTKSKSRLPCDCNTTEGLRQICKESASLTSADIVEMQNIAEMAKKEKQMKAQIEELQKREQQYQKATRNVESVFTKTSNLCCHCHATGLPTNMNAEIEKISRELRLENEILKSELVEMKLELRHCLEKIEGPMKLKLQTEKQKCECLQKELQESSKNILLSQDTYSREMNQLKLQLCCACSNITDLNQMNQRLKDEMSNLDCLCQKLEDDLIKQKLNEAETIKRLTNRGPSGNAGGLRSVTEEFKCDSSLDVIARKLSKTIKDLAPCEECSKLPTELASAAKCIKDLTDMVRKRKVGAAFSAGGCNCQSGVPSRTLFGESCACCQGDTGDKFRHKVKTGDEKTVKTLHPVPGWFAENVPSSKIDVDKVQSSYYSAGEIPCYKFGTPCAQSKGTSVTKDHEAQWPCTPIGEPCRKDPSDRPSGVGKRPCTPIGEPCGRHPTDEPSGVGRWPCTPIGEPCRRDPTDKPSGVGKRPCTPIGEPCRKDPTVKDKSVQEVPKFEKQTETKPPEPVKKPLETSSLEGDILKITDSIIDKVVGDKTGGPPIEEPSGPPIVEPKGPPIVEPSGPPIEEPRGPPIEEPKGPATEEPGPPAIEEPGPPAIEEPGSPAIEEPGPPATEEPGPPATVVPEVPATVEPPEPLEHKTTPGESVENLKTITEGSGEITTGKPTTVSSSQVAVYQETPPHPDATIEEEIPKDPPREIIPVEKSSSGGHKPVPYPPEESEDNMLMTTILTDTGSLQVVTTAPQGTIETTLKYAKDGQIEVASGIYDRDVGKKPTGRAAVERSMPPTSDSMPCTPEARCDMMQPLSGYEICGQEKTCQDIPDKNMFFMPIDSSKFSGVSGPEAETSYTTSAFESDLTSKMDTTSSGVRPDMTKTPDLTSAFGESSAPTGHPTAGKMPEKPSSAKHFGQTIAGRLGSKEIPGFDEASSEELLQPDAPGLVIMPDQIQPRGLKEKESDVAATSEKQTVAKVDGQVGPGEEATFRVLGEQSLEETPEKAAVKISSRAGQGVSEEAEGGTSTTGEVKSGEVFTPEQGVSDLEEESREKVAVGIAKVVASERAYTGFEASGELVMAPEQGVSDLGEGAAGIAEIVSSEQTYAGFEASGELFMDAQVLDESGAEYLVQDLDTAFSVPRDETTDKVPGPPGTSKTRDCGCQSKIQTDQSCQCCECKTIGISTSGDKETITEKSEEMEKALQESIEDAKTDTDSEFVSVSEAPTSGILQQGDVPEDIAAAPSKPTYSVTDYIFENYPKLKGKSLEEQEKWLKEKGIELSEEAKEKLKKLDESYDPEEDELPVVTEELLAEHPELATMSLEEQHKLLKSVSFKASKDINEDVELTEEFLAEHPELATMSLAEQQKSLKSLGYKPSAPIHVDSTLLQKHPELAGKTSKEQEAILKDLGYSVPSVVSAAKAPSAQIVDSAMLQKHPELAGKTSKEQEAILKDLGYSVPAVVSAARTPSAQIVDSAMLKKHPELAGKSIKEQRAMLEDLGYELPQTASEGPQRVVDYDTSKISAVVSKELLDKHPELVGKAPKEQESILKDLGYSVPALVSAAKTPSAQIHVSSAMLQKHPELAGKTSKEQESILKDLGYSVPALVSAAKTPSAQIHVSSALLQKHPELAGKSIKEQQALLKDLGYELPQTASEGPQRVVDYTTPKLSDLVDKKLLDKHPELVGKTSQEQEVILKDLGYVAPAAVSAVKTPAQVHVDSAMLQKHPELAGKPIEEQHAMLKDLGYELPRTASRAPQKVVDYDTSKPSVKELLDKHPELVGESSKEQEEILKDLGYAVPAAVSIAKAPSIRVDSALLQKHPELAGKPIEEQHAMLKDLGYELPRTASSAPQKVVDYATSKPSVNKELLDKHPELVGKSSKEQEEILKDLGYAVPAAASIAKAPSIRVDSALLQKHPELAGKDIEEQQAMLKDLGYKTPQTASRELQKVISISKPSLKKLVDEELLNKHPELVGKSSKEQEEILKDLGYSVPAVVSIAKIPSALLEEHPELAGKDIEEQQAILEELGYELPKIASVIAPAAISSIKELPPKASKLIIEELLDKHPELVGKSSQEQQQILTELGYAVPTEESVSKFMTPEQSSKDVSVTCKAPCRTAGKPSPPKAPEPSTQGLLVGKSSQEQKQSLRDLGYAAPTEEPSSQQLGAAEISSDAKFMTPEQSSKDVSVTCRAPCRTAGTPTSDSSRKTPSQSARSIPRLIPRQPASKEASISCKASVRSKATLQSVSPKQSAKKIISIGDVSEAVERQQRPQSRDDSVSCKASCKTISVQSSRGKEVKELVAARSDTTTTSSSLSEKDKLKKQSKKSLEEVPSIVSQLSDKERPAIESTSRKPKMSRKRRPKAFDCMKCVCNDPCECGVCTPAKKPSKSLKRTVRSCDCPPNMMMVPQMIVMPPMQMSYSMPPTGHATNCRCNACIYRENIPSSSNVRGRTHADTATEVKRQTKPADTSTQEAGATAKHADTSTDEADAKKKLKHPSSCECIDCLCMPKIKKLANTKEYPIVYDTKQIYQVKVKCDTCVNAQNARRYLEQQAAARSRIPISTSTANPPTYRSAAPPPVANPAREGESSGSVYGSIACDCEQCKCNECPDEKIARPAKPQPTARMAATPSSTQKGDKNCCCTKSPCECQPCTVEELTKKLKEAEDKLAAVQKPTSRPQLAPEKPAEVAGDEECTCVVCSCPRSDLMDKPKGDAEEEEPCTCVECVCPGADLLKPGAIAPVKSATVAPVKSATVAPIKSVTVAPPTSAGDADHPPDCNCPVCTCPAIDEYKKGFTSSQAAVVKPSVTVKESVTAKSSGGIRPAPSAVGAGDEECTCVVCECPGKTNLPPKPSESGSKEDSCDCSDCKCSPCADPKKRAITVLGDPIIEDCDCSECLCAPCADPKKRTEQGPPPVKSTTVAPVQSTTVPPVKSVTLAPTGVPSVSSKLTGMPEKVPHPADCPCDECKCLEEIIQTESVHQTETGVQPRPEEKEIHGLQCSCPECVCVECETKGTHAIVCKCPECVCTDCPVMDVEGRPTVAGTASTHAPAVAGKSSTHAPTVPGTTSTHAHKSDCTCIKCVCDICGDGPVLKGVPSKAKPSAVRIASKPSQMVGCLCGECVCVECAMKEQRPQHVVGCRCTECLCVECPESMGPASSGVFPKVPSGVPSKVPSGVPSKVPSGVPPKVSSRGGDFVLEKSPMVEQPSILMGVTESRIQGDCICKTCICIDCKVTGSHAQGECLCKTTCTCADCTGQLGGKASERQIPGRSAGMIPSSQGPPKGPSGAALQSQVPSKAGVGFTSQVLPVLPAPTESMHEDGPCTCPVCDCKPCFKLEKPIEECTCQVCECLVCSKILPDGTVKAAPSGAGEGSRVVEAGTHSSSCTCKDCQCGPGLQPKAKGNLGAEIGLHDPPPFQLVDRIDCDCKKCDCIICEERKAMASAMASAMAATGRALVLGQKFDVGTHQSHVGMMPEGYVAPPFEIPTRVDCEVVCKECTCIICNKYGPPQKAVAAQPSVAFAAQPSFNLVQQPSVHVTPVVQATASIHSRNCLCPVCTCEETLEQMRQASAAQMQQASAAQMQQAASGQILQAPSAQIQQVPSVRVPSQAASGQIPQVPSVQVQQIPSICLPSLAASGQLPQAPSVQVQQVPSVRVPSQAASGQIQQAPSVQVQQAPSFRVPSQAASGQIPQAPSVQVQQVPSVRVPSQAASGQIPQAPSVQVQLVPSVCVPSLAASGQIPQAPSVQVQQVPSVQVQQAPSVQVQQVPSVCVPSLAASGQIPQAPSVQVQQVPSVRVPSQAASGQIPQAPSVQVQQVPSVCVPSLAASGQIPQVPSVQVQPARSVQIQQARSVHIQEAPSAAMPQAPSGQIQVARSGQIQQVSSRPMVPQARMGASSHIVSSVCSTTRYASAQASAVRPEPSGVTPIHCDCPTCTCEEAAKPVVPQPVLARCICPTCTCEEDIIKSTMPATSTSVTRPQSASPIRQEPSATARPVASTRPDAPFTATPLPETITREGVVLTPAYPSEGYQSAATLVLPEPDIREMYPENPPARAPCDCPPGRCVCQPCNDKTIRPSSRGPVESSRAMGRSAAQPVSAVRTMDNLTLVKSIQAANKENCECKEQIEEIKRTLEKIRCSCNEAMYRSTQSMGQQMGSEGQFTSQPFVKQASPFGQTMSGLKMALSNLQQKCKAKDKMIEAMTAELAQRGDVETFDKVLDNSEKMHSALDYDQAQDIKSFERSQLITNVIYAPTQVADQGTVPIRNVASKGIEVRSHKHKKKPSSSKGQRSQHECDNCECSLPPIIQTEEKDCQKLDLTGFEVVDIRRITDDSLIVKWNAPNNQKVQGYDIFVNGTMASKVMSGTRTSAMIHSLDLTKSVQITIYAATRCGRVDPPAIAIYEIKG